MARIRTIKPDFWTDGNMISLSFEARLFYIGTWNFALCDHGHLPDDALGLKLKILPADNVNAQALLDELMTSGRLVRLRLPDGRTFLDIVRFEDHQKVDARWQSRCPVCTFLSKTHASSDEAQGDSRHSAETRLGGEGKGEERNGREGGAVRAAANPPPPVDNSEPPLRCPDHVGNPMPPACGRCKDARLLHEAWAATRSNVTPITKPIRHIDGLCDAHRQREDDCEMCRREHTGKWVSA